MTQILFSQSDLLVHGQILSNKKAVANIQIVNLVNEKSCVSDQNGNFEILAKTDDMLVFLSNEYDYKRKSLDIKDINDNCLIVDLFKKAIQLNEVVIYNYSKINAVALGIIPANTKSYSPAERRLLASNGLSLARNIDGTTGGSLSADPIFNKLSSRTKQLKQQLDVEQKEKMLVRLNLLYMNNFYSDKLKINQELIKAFQFYIIEDEDFKIYFDTNNKSSMHFRIIQLSEEFHQLQQTGK